MALTITNSDDSALSGDTFTIERGTESAHKEVKIKNTGATPVAGASVVMFEEVAGDWVSSGGAAVDELMGRFEITSQDSTATPGQQIVLGQVQVMGHLRAALLPTILAGDWIIADIWLQQGTSSASGAAFNVKFQVAEDEPVVPIAEGISAFAHGVLTGLYQQESFVISGRATTATGTPDDQVHTATGSWLLDGAEYTDGSARASTLNQNDGAAAALASGQSYIAVLTQSSSNAPTVTKGLKGTSPTRPTPPAGEIILAWVTVSYQAGGTSVIQNSDIDADLTYGRLLVTAPATGLSAVVHAGKAIGEGFMQVHGLKETVTLTGSATNRIWLQTDGLVVKTLSDTPPSPGAHWLANAATDGSSVTTLTDKRTFITTTGVTLANHASAHAYPAGPDAVSPASIGAAAASHTHAESDVTNLTTDLAAKAPLASPTFTGTVTLASQVSTGGQTRNVTTKATADSPYAVAATDYVILGNTSGGNLTITLPASPAQGRWLEIKNINGGTNTLTVDRNGKNIDGAAANFTTTTNNLARTFVYDATFGWAVL